MKMATYQCRCLHERFYSDFYPSNRPIIWVDNVSFSLVKLGYKHCSTCMFFTTKETSKTCKCCNSRMKNGKAKYESRKKSWQKKKKIEDKIIFKYPELVCLSEMVNAHIPRSRNLKYHIQRRKTNKQILDIFINKSNKR